MMAWLYRDGEWRQRDVPISREGKVYFEIVFDRFDARKGRTEQALYRRNATRARLEYTYISSKFVTDKLCVPGDAADAQCQ